MKSIVCFLFCTLLCTAAAFAQPTTVQVRHLPDHYFTGGDQNIELKEGINCFVLTNRKQYEKFFGTTTRPDTPQFSKEVMLVLLMPSSKKDSKLAFQRVDMKAGNFIEVYCDVQTNMGKNTYTTYPVAACAIPRYANVTTMKFYDAKNMRRITTVPVKKQ
jgi:hypothetical protein